MIISVHQLCWSWVLQYCLYKMDIGILVDIAGALVLAPILCAIIYGDWDDDSAKPP